MNETFTLIDKPTIVVSNHPNTLLDPLFAAATVSQQVNFLANYSLFKSKFGNWLFDKLYCIPVQRPEDVNGGRTNNLNSIARSHQFLADGGTPYVAAEGYSIQSLGIRPLKTGAARLALGTENEQGWNADIQILPIGLNYNEADRFRSSLVIHVGKPYNVKEWRADYYDNPKDTVRAVTRQLENQMRSVLLDTDDARTAVLKTVRSYLSLVKPAEPKREYLRARKILVDLKAIDSDAVQEIQKEIQQYESNCATSQLSGVEVAAAYHDKSNPIRLSHLIGSLPITIIGFITNVIPYLLCHWIEQIGNKLLVYRSTFRVLPSIIIFPLMYLFWMWVISYLTNNVILTLGSVLIYRRAGIYAWHEIERWSRYFKSKRIITQDPQHMDHLDVILNSVHRLSV